MYDMINRAVVPIINQGSTSSDRLQSLIYIKEFINRISTRDYISQTELTDLEKKYGVKPDIITWGDFFQAEMATSMQTAEDEIFMKAVETVKFDMISSYMIFSGKDTEFFEWVEDSFISIMTIDKSDYTAEDEEILHLKILMDYFTEMGVTNRFNETELLWYSSFKDAEAI